MSPPSAYSRRPGDRIFVDRDAHSPSSVSRDSGVYQRGAGRCDVKKKKKKKKKKTCVECTPRFYCANARRALFAFVFASLLATSPNARLQYPKLHYAPARSGKINKSRQNERGSAAPSLQPELRQPFCVVCDRVLVFSAFQFSLTACAKATKHIASPNYSHNKVFERVCM
jgi:hypothetical protein